MGARFYCLAELSPGSRRCTSLQDYQAQPVGAVQLPANDWGPDLKFMPDATSLYSTTIEQDRVANFHSRIGKNLNLRTINHAELMDETDERQGMLMGSEPYTADGKIYGSRF